MRKSGFTLVEVALALLVIGIGVVAVFGLFPAGMEAGRQTINETQAAQFAEEVFNAYRALATITNLTVVAGAQVSVAATPQWSAPDPIVPDNTIRASVLKAAADSQLVERALRYQLNTTLDGSYILRLSLRIYPGEFGPTTESYNFYTEIGRTTR